MTTGPSATANSEAIATWEGLGTYRTLLGYRIFTIDAPPTSAVASTPLLIIHGFPTSSFDYRLILDALRVGRRVLLLDMLGFGLSDKPDLHYTVSFQVDLICAFLDEIGVDEVALLTHDFGDTVGGELLARVLEGSTPISVSRRVVTNGSIYIEMAHLNDGQKLLLSLNDEMLPEELAPTTDALCASLASTLSPHHGVDPNEIADHAALIAMHHGQRVLPRTIRYIEERRANEARFTGAIEAHPSPLAIVWGADDPIAVVAMSARLHRARPDAQLTVLDQVGHYPMVEAPQLFVAPVLAGLDS
jgi:pimeloyl-ACP methyl ester carboxylesterase